MSTTLKKQMARERSAASQAKKRRIEREYSEQMERSRAFASAQKLNRDARFGSVITSSAFQRRFFDLGLGKWNEYVMENPIEACHLEEFLILLTECFSLHRQFGKYFNVKMVLNCFHTRKLMGIEDTYGWLPDFSSETLLANFVDLQAVRLNQWEGLTGRERRGVIQAFATPSWRNAEKIRAIYAECARMKKVTGEDYHVDHIIPLQGKRVCGLHVENNLQIIPAAENLQKLNKFDIDSEN